MRWLENVTNAMNMNLGKFQEMVRDKEACCAGVHGVAKSQTGLGDQTCALYLVCISLTLPIPSFKQQYFFSFGILNLFLPYIPIWLTARNTSKDPNLKYIHVNLSTINIVHLFIYLYHLQFLIPVPYIVYKYRSSAFLGKFSPRYFILIDVMVNAIISLISLSDILLLVTWLFQRFFHGFD